jgi:hypothetical protein
VKNQIREQNFETEGSTNGYIIHIVVGSNWPMGAAVAAPYLAPVALLLLQRLGAVAPTPSQPVLCSINPESSGVSPHSLSTLHFHSLSLSLAPSLAKVFSTKLKCKKTL